MKKLVFKKKKRVRVCSYKKKVFQSLCKAAAVMLLLGTVTGGALPASAMELTISEGGVTVGKQTISFVYHQHIGSEKQEGGCYQKPVYHQHTGSEAAGGSCYRTPVYHVHEGDETSGGACYQTAVYHVHDGSGDSEEGCYGPVYHSHGKSCYKEVSSKEYGCYTQKTVDTSDGDSEGKDYKYYYMSCGRVVHGTDSSHTHSVLSCKKGNTVTGYALVCGKTEESVEGYAFDCKKTAETIDSYQLSCVKTSNDIDGYERSCQKTEDTPCGRLVLNEEIEEGRKKAVLTVSFEDLTGGEITLGTEPFTWYDGQGKKLGQGDNLAVSQNGSYSVKVNVLNEDINKNSLKAKITVDNLIKAASDKGDSDKGDSDKGDSGKAEETSGKAEEISEKPDSDSGSRADENGKRTEPSGTPVVSPFPKADDSQSMGEGKTAQNLRKQTKETPDKEAETASPSQAPILQKQTETVTLEERKSEGEIGEIKVAEQEKSFSVPPLAAFITITAGALFSFGGLFLLLYLLRRSVKVYNDDGRGSMFYLGRCMVKAGEEGDYIRITEKMEEKAVTNRYSIRPGLFGAFKGEEEELTVCRQQKRISLPVRKEMTAVL